MRCVFLRVNCIDSCAGGDKDRRLFYIWIHVAMVPAREGMHKLYSQQFTRFELDKLDKSAGVSQPYYCSPRHLVLSDRRHSCFAPAPRPPPPPLQLPANFLVELHFKGSPTVTETYAVHPEIILEYIFPFMMNLALLQLSLALSTADPTACKTFAPRNSHVLTFVLQTC